MWHTSKFTELEVTHAKSGKITSSKLALIFYTIRFKFGHLTLTIGQIYCGNLIIYLDFSYRQIQHSIQILLLNLFSCASAQPLSHNHAPFPKRYAIIDTKTQGGGGVTRS